MIILGDSSLWCYHVFTRHPVAVETEATKQAEMRTMSRSHTQAEQHAYTLNQSMPDHATEYTARIQSHAYCR
ncbi:Piso0_003317 [Millerozyma farinosa CBS 7064]|uniref:Piso0_003317 protein n=1 Tax=Pichia sorbitophila (strain ATCC MYA-4447 / BCRC 22081 / CBS 7064 / NBRC 10061 / NRRL Y-12695) TaxID=559304 RepID=G8YHS8_PICSO|nr:Piso0_003317 [Millerozyma farinosa CBS 7064]CCE80980.1 Piso0_003317 [Millerozyma farinosa CBS 7064]